MMVEYLPTIATIQLNLIAESKLNLVFAASTAAAVVVTATIQKHGNVSKSLKILRF